MSVNIPRDAASADPAGQVTTRLQWCRIIDGKVPLEESRPSFSTGIKSMAFAPDNQTVFLDHPERLMSLITARPVLKTLTLTPPTVQGGATGEGTLTLSIPAGANGVEVHLSVNKAFVSVPTAVLVPAGAKKATFSFTTRKVLEAKTAAISATFDYLTLKANLAVNP
jgi:hypothetical protein